MKSIFHLEHITFAYRTQAAPLFNDLNLELRKGEALVILGPSGGGKSTLLKMMAGLIPPIEGQVTFEGSDFYKMDAAKRRIEMRRIGMTFQNSGLFDSLSCGENLSFSLEESKVDKDKHRAIVCDALNDVGLSGIENLRTHQISGGMRKRLGIARALILSPEIIFYDDPTAGLDPITSDQISDLILKMKEKYKMTVVAVTGDLSQAYRIADRIAFLHQGKFLQVDTVKNIRASQHPVVKQFVNGLLDGPLTNNREMA